ncbi:hypothetical protein SKAU_G00368020 [Synaphobranchus kaupii]|uniref:Uncharacterized protein n=1 Tax=Synaphobranchus kaupii TaxID=118154 RepID=A0A9Q1EFH9_SYNKA|nr:hypothetical protein SKAU_G00368020 [Synaphobranchus kaupii]
MRASCPCKLEERKRYRNLPDRGHHCSPATPLRGIPDSPSNHQDKDTLCPQSLMGAHSFSHHAPERGAHGRLAGICMDITFPGLAGQGGIPIPDSGAERDREVFNEGLRRMSSQI